MIGAKMRSGAYWDWRKDDALSVNGRSFPLDAIAALELEECRIGGRDIDLGGRTWRDLVVTDPETGIHVVLSMPLELAREVGGHLSGTGKLVLATEMPRPPT